MEDLQQEVLGYPFEKVAEFFGVEKIPEDAKMMIYATSFTFLTEAFTLFVPAASGAFSFNLTGFTLAKITLRLKDIQKSINTLLDIARKKAVDNIIFAVSKLEDPSNEEGVRDSLKSFKKAEEDAHTGLHQSPDVNGKIECLKILCFSKLAIKTFSKEKGTYVPFHLMKQSSKKHLAVEFCHVINEILDLPEIVSLHKSLRRKTSIFAPVQRKLSIVTGAAKNQETIDDIDTVKKMVYPMISEGYGLTDPKKKWDEVKTFYLFVATKYIPEGENDAVTVCLGVDENRDKVNICLHMNYSEKEPLLEASLGYGLQKFYAVRYDEQHPEMPEAYNYLFHLTDDQIQRFRRKNKTNRTTSLPTDFKIASPMKKKPTDNEERNKFDQDFQDPFTSNSSLCETYEGDPSVEWKSITQICPVTTFMDQCPKPTDFMAGELGDSWILAAAACLANNPQLFRCVIPNNQRSNYFTCKLWMDGSWKDIMVDTCLPVKSGRPFYCKSNGINYWGPLLEKAFAKMHGTFKSLNGGVTAEAMLNLTGGYVETIQVTKVQENGHFDKLRKLLIDGCLLACSEVRANTEHGLKTGLPYSIISAKEIIVDGIEMRLVRLSCPWGRHICWEGPWGRRSAQWNIVPDLPNQFDMSSEEDGSFLMTFTDFWNSFGEIQVGHGPDQGLYLRHSLEGAWVKGQSAGGCRNFRETFNTNPQFLLEVSSTSAITISLVQKGYRTRKLLGAENISIGFYVYSLEGHSLEKKDQEFFEYNSAKFWTENFFKHVETTGTFQLENGSYLIIPTTFNPGNVTQFLIRVFADNQVKLCQL